MLNGGGGMAEDAAGNIYLPDIANSRIRKIDALGVIATFAGTGIRGFSPDGTPASTARLNNPNWLQIDNVGNLYFSDENNYRIRMIDASGMISTIAGTGVNGYSGDGGMAYFGGIAVRNGVAE